MKKVETLGMAIFKVFKSVTVQRYVCIYLDMLIEEWRQLRSEPQEMFSVVGGNYQRAVRQENVFIVIDNICMAEDCQEDESDLWC